MLNFDHADLWSWLDWIGSLHKREIDYTLERVRAVAQQLDLTQQTSHVITVSGTNGKGSTVRILEAIYLSSGLTVGTYTSPSLFSYNERIRMGGEPVSDETIINAFKQIEQVRDDILLTPFEYTKLAAWLMMKKAKLDLMLLEVGLGGRLDAVNIVDPDLAIVTSIGLDHCELLGDNREQIAQEKSGIFRSQKPAICGELDCPQALESAAKDLSCPFYCQGRDFQYHVDDGHWTFINSQMTLDKLPIPKLNIQNAATALMAISCMLTVFNVSTKAIKKGLATADLPARFQVIDGDITHILDVAHNPHASKHLASCIASRPSSGRTFAIFSMLEDKDIKGTIAHLIPYVDVWFIAPLNVKWLKSRKSATIDLLEKAIKENHIKNYHKCASIKLAYKQVKAHTQKGDTILIFGSHFILPPIWGEIPGNVHEIT